MSSNFLVWRPGSLTDGICKLSGLLGVEDDFEIDQGISLAARWPADASAKMDPDYPKDIGLADSLYGTTYLVVSEKAKRFLEGQDAGPIELLPLSIVNHKDRLASKDYFVVNALESVDCIDREASQVSIDAIDDVSIDGCERLVLREDVIPKALKVFRLAFWTSRVVIRRELAEKMIAAGLTGMYFLEPGEYTGIV